MEYISLKHTHASSVILKKKDVSNKKHKRAFDLSFKTVYNDEKKREFQIIFSLNVSDAVSFRLSVEYIAIFQTGYDIDEEFIKSDFPKVNAPAIAFPYLRSFVSLLMLNTGYGNVFLPSINFIELNKQQENTSN